MYLSTLTKALMEICVAIFSGFCWHLTAKQCFFGPDYTNSLIEKYKLSHARNQIQDNTQSLATRASLRLNLIILWGGAVVSAVFTILWITVFRPTIWVWADVCCCALMWSTVALAVLAVDWHQFIEKLMPVSKGPYHGEPPEVPRSLKICNAIICCILFVSLAGTIVISGLVEDAGSGHVDRQVLSTQPIYAVGATYGSTGSGQGMLFRGTTFAISIDGVYRYWLQDEVGDFYQESIPIQGTKIHYITEEEQPYLRKIASYDYSDHYPLFTDGTTTKRTYYNAEYHYELCIPEGSIVLSQYDLN